MAEGLQDSAATLRTEAAVGPTKVMSAENSLQVLLSSGILRPDSAVALRTSLGGRGSTSHPMLTMAHSAEKMAQHRKGLDKLQNKVRQFQGSPMFAMAASEDIGENEGDLQEELARWAAETTVLMRALEERRIDDANMEVRLKHAKEELAFLQAAQQVPPPPQPTGLEAIQLILTHWTEPSYRHTALMLFAQVDRNSDGRLNWNSDEIRAYVRAMFRHYEVAIPPWPDPVWYQMYRQCDVDGSCSLEQEEAIGFARLCFEAALRHMEENLLAQGKKIY